MMAKVYYTAMPIYAFSCGEREKRWMCLWLTAITHILLILAGALLQIPQEKEHHRNFSTYNFYQPRAGYPAVKHPT